MKNVRIKICGITSVYDARMVSSFQIHAIRLNLIKRSKRKIGIKTAREILDKLPPLVEPVLIFENEKIKAKKTIIGIFNTIKLIFITYTYKDSKKAEYGKNNNTLGR